MQALSSIGRRPSEQSVRTAEVWRNILSSCVLGDTLCLDFVVTTGSTGHREGANGPKVASFTGSVSAVVDKSKKSPKVMFRAEGFREQIQLPPVPVSSSSIGSLGTPGSDAASLIEFLANSKLVGAAVMRRDRESNASKVVLSLGTRAKMAASEQSNKVVLQTESSAEVTKETLPGKVSAGIDIQLNESCAGGTVEEKPRERTEENEGERFEDDVSESDIPFFLMPDEHKSSFLGGFFERLYVDEPTAVHLGATMLLSLLSPGPQLASEGTRSATALGSTENECRFQNLYTQGAVAHFKQGSQQTKGMLNATQSGERRSYECDDDAYDSNRDGKPQYESSCSEVSRKCEWEAIGAGAFASVYKVSSKQSTAAIKLVRGLLHSGEEGSDETQLSLFQKVTAELRSHLVPEHMETCPSVAKALGLPSKAAIGLSGASFRELRKSVGLPTGKQGKLDELPALPDGSLGVAMNEHILPSIVRGDVQWYERPLAALSNRFAAPRIEFMDVVHMQAEAESSGVPGDRNGPRSAPPGRVSFFPFPREVQLLMEWRELMEMELRNGHPSPHELDTDEQSVFGKPGLDRKLKRAHDQHCYSLLLRSHGSTVRPRDTLVSTTKKGSLPTQQAGLSVADIFASRKTFDPAAACGMTIQRPAPSPCHLGFTSGAIGIRQSSVGELLNLQLCTGKDHVVGLNDWGYRGSRLGEFLDLSIAFLVEVACHTFVGKTELLNLSSLSSVVSLFGQNTSNMVTSLSRGNGDGQASFLATRHFELSKRLAPKHVSFTLDDPLFPSIEHLLACAQSQLAYFGLPSLLEGTAGIVMPFCDQPLNKLQRKVSSMVSDRKTIAEVVNSEFRERMGVLKKMEAYLASSHLPRKESVTHGFLEPIFDNPFGYTLHDEETRFWIGKLHLLEDLNARIQSSSPPNRLLISSSRYQGGVGPDKLDDGAARILLLHRFSDRAERLSLAIGVLRDLVPALESLHSTDVVHRDVKPNNIMVIRERSFKVPCVDGFDGHARDGVQPIPRLLFDFLGCPHGLLDRNRCSFELIDLGWGRVLPAATVGTLPLPGVTKEEDVAGDPDTPVLEESESENDDDEERRVQVKRRGTMVSPGERQFDEVDHRRRRSLYVGPKGANAALPLVLQPSSSQLASAHLTAFQQLPYLPQHALWGQTQIGQKRGRDATLSVIQDLSLGVPNFPGHLRPAHLHAKPFGGLPHLASSAIQKLDPKLFSMQRKVAAFKGIGASAPPISGQSSLEGVSFSELESASFPLPAGGALLRSDFSTAFRDGRPADPTQSNAGHSGDESDEGDDEDYDDPTDFLLSGPAGNMCYRAPEFLLGPREPVLIPGATGPDGSRYAYSPSIDVFALGTVLFELLTGTRFLKVRPQELEHQELRNGHLLQRMVESLGFPKVWVAEVVVKLRGTKPSSFPRIILQSPYALGRIRSASALRVAQKCVDQIEAFFLVDSVRRNRVVDAPSLGSAISYAWEEIIFGTTSAAKMHSISDTSGSTGGEVFCEADNDITGSKDSMMRSSMIAPSGKIRPYCIVPVRLLGQHGYAGVLYQHQEMLDVLRGEAAYGLPQHKRPPTSTFVTKCLQQKLKPAWAYEPRAASRTGFKSLLEVDEERRNFAVKSGISWDQTRGTFSGTPVPEAAYSPRARPTDADRVYEMVGLVSRMLSWEPSERPTLREVLSSGCYKLLCGSDRGFYDL